ncbi:MAG: serine hydrolase [Planctomycetes bacterium]|nr:serine hydrolase [Planctomycetota bacterium]
MIHYIRYFLILTAMIFPCVQGESDGLAPEVTDLNASDISWNQERNLPYLENAYISGSPQDISDGIQVGKLGADGGDEKLVRDFAHSIAQAPQDTKHSTDSLLIWYKGKLLFESYYRRGRINVPHYQMSITKSYTALALGRAMQLGYISMADLNRPVLSFLKDVDGEKLAPGSESVLLHEAMHMKSGIRVDNAKAKKAMKTPENLVGQKQIQTYLELSAPITEKSKSVFKYQGSDPTITMQVLSSILPVKVEDFIRKDFLGKLGITSYGWQTDVSGFPKAAAGSSFRSRDMLKMGILVYNKGAFNGEQVIPAEFIERAISPLDVSKYRTYGYFWWGHKAKVKEKDYKCVSGRGAGGQFIQIFPDLELIIIVTSHNKGMGTMLKDAPLNIIPAFAL